MSQKFKWVSLNWQTKIHNTAILAYNILKMVIEMV